MRARWGLALTSVLAPLTLGAAAPPPKLAPEGQSTSATALVVQHVAVSLPDRIRVAAGVEQLITVTSRSWASRHAYLNAWQRDASGQWRLRFGPMRAVLGYSGWVKAADRVQSTGTTPAGDFRLPYAFGRLSNPGTNLLYRQFDRNDWWPYEPRDRATYNVYQFHKTRTTFWRPNKAERLWDYHSEYAYAAVIGFNLSRGIHYSATRRQRVATVYADTTRGGGIFLHVRGDGYTAGCVGVTRAQMRAVLKWLRPDAHPRIVMGPRSYVVRG